jgi:hypothetical protein
MINHQDLSHFGASVQRAGVAAGTTYWKLIEARHADPNREFGGDQHVYIEALDEQGNKLRNVQAQIEAGSEVHHPTLDKNLQEPGTNWPLWRGSQVFVSMRDAASDRVGPLHTEMGAYKGGDLFHHTWYLVFQRARADGQPVEELPAPPVAEEPPAPPVTPPDPAGPGTGDSSALDDATLRTIREESWRQVHVAFNRDSSFARYARQHNLGAPLTNEYDAGAFRAQGFAGGIVYARIGDWANIRHVTW